MTLGKLHSLPYGIARLLGDVNAVKRGAVVRRLARRRVGAVPVTSHTTSPTPAMSGRIRSQNGAISVEWYGEGSGSL